MKIKQFDKSNLKLLRSEIDFALRDIGNRYGIKLNAGRASYMEKSATFKLELMTLDDSGNAITKEAQTLRAYLGVLGLRESHLDQKFLLGGKTFKLIGYNPRKYAKPFQLLCMEDGKTYVAREEQVKQALGLRG